MDTSNAHTQAVLTVTSDASITSEVVVLGDFNLPGLKWRSSHDGFMYPDPEQSVFNAGSTSIMDCYSIATLQQINNNVNENNRTLDLCFVSSQDVAPQICVAPSPLVKTVPHHPPLIISLQNSNVSGFTDTPVPVKYDYRRADYPSIVNLLSSLDWNDILDQDDADAAALTFTHVLGYVIDRHIPKRVASKSRHPPWQTNELRRLKTAKKAALRRYTKYRTLSLKDHYLRLNHAYKRSSRQCHSDFQLRVQRRLRSNPKYFWKYVNEQRKESGLPSSMVHNGEVSSNTQKICELFSAKFASVFSNETLSFQQIARAANNVPLFGQTLTRIDIDDSRILTATSKLKSSTNPGPDGIPSIFLKKCITCLLSPLRHLFHLSLTSGTFPKCWKNAHVFPVHKKGDRRDVDNYRGISTLCAASKLFEIIVMETLAFYTKQYISEDQHGFVPNLSTATNLL